MADKLRPSVPAMPPDAWREVLTLLRDRLATMPPGETAYWLGIYADTLERQMNDWRD